MFPIDTKILVVDDMPAIRKMVKGILQQLGYRNISEAENGTTAWEQIHIATVSGDRFGLILSDWNMPSMKGIDLLRKVRGTQEISATPFLLITAEQEFTNVKEALALKVNDYLIKPFTPASFKIKLETVWKKLGRSG